MIRNQHLAQITAGIFILIAAAGMSGWLTYRMTTKGSGLALAASECSFPSHSDEFFASSAPVFGIVPLQAPINLCSSSFTIHATLRTTQPGQIIDASNGTETSFSRGLGLSVSKGGEPCNGGTIAPSSRGDIYLNYATSSGKELGFCSNYNVTDGAWHTVDISVQRQGSLTFSLDGELQAGSETTLTGPLSLATMQIGKGQWGEPFTGDIKDIRIYDHYLSSKDVAAIKDGGDLPL